MKPRILTNDEVKHLALSSNEKFALVDKSKNAVFLGSSSQASIESDFNKMIENGHPEAKDLELVAQP